MSRRFQFSLSALLVLTALVAVLCILFPVVYEFVFPTPRVLVDTIVVERGVRYHHLSWSNGAQTMVPADAAGIEARNGAGHWRVLDSARPASAPRK
jgi:hypothetical protein